LNEDLSVVQYKEFHQTSDDIFPTVSLCLGNPFLKVNLSEYGVNETSYREFLRGKVFTKEMLNINFSRVTIDIVDYIKGYRMYFRNMTYKKFDSGLTLREKQTLIFRSYNGFIGPYGTFYKCFALNIPAINDLDTFRILISNEIFPGGERPINGLLNTFVHLPKQFLLSHHTAEWIWPYQSKVERYIMRFIIRDSEVVIKRDKKQQRCNEYWNDYDDWVINIHSNETGCNTPYQVRDKILPMCNTQELMTQGMLHSSIVDRQEYTKPCKTMSTARIDYTESSFAENTSNETSGAFWFSITLPLNTYRKIVQTR
jgi:hypothetical protein